MKRLIPYINHEVKILEAQLQTEESGTKIAIIQGKLVGYNSMISILNEIESEDFKLVKESKPMPCVYDSDIQKWNCRCNDFDVVLGLRVMFNNVEERLKRFNELGENKVKQRKDWLFYTAEKGRDLHFVKGWFFMFNILNSWKEAVNSQYEYLSSEKRKDLLFDVEIEDD